MSDLPLVPLSGSPLERGRQHGEALSERIAENVDLYNTRMRQDAGLSDDDLTRRVDFYHDVFRRFSPDYVTTMTGIAEGSRQTINDIVMLNARFELLYSAWSAAGTPASECTGFGALRSLSTDDTQRIGQNWDWFDRVRGGLLTWEDDGLTTLAYTEAGIAGVKIGVNSAGIGLCVNGLSSDVDDWSRGGLPFHLRTSMILGSRSLAEAVGHATVGTPSCSANFMIGSRDGIVDVESSPVGARRIPAEPDRVLVHANHFLDPEVLGVTQTWRTKPVTTFHRHERLDALLNEPEKLSAEDIQASLCDHEGQIKAVCRHPDPETPEHMRIHTAFTAIIDLDNGQLDYTEGPPCESEFTTVTLADAAELLGA